MIIGVIVGVLLLVGLTVGIMATNGKDRPKLRKENIPEDLGALNLVPIQPMLHLLNAALDYEYIQQVKQRFLQENPNRSEVEFEWLLFELKRYFLVSNLLKKAPMFSKDVDEIWHEMILFTKEYQDFSEGFLGEMLHHIPNTNPKPAPHDRALFDWVFSQLFKITEFSWKAWGSFFKHPLSSEILKEFKESSQDELIKKYFRQNEDNKELAEYLVNRMKQQLNEAEKIYRIDKKGSFTKQRTYGDMTFLSLVMVFFSYYYFDEYWEYAKVYAFTQAANNTSGCSTAVFCGTASTDRSGNGHGDGPADSSGDSGGGSSSSSCSGGCSS
ncbi:hypothetical protein [Halalkalibacter alkalisediminis]|uniref:Uncharacterized protein n=1 Tax=Halalkalibacter alkalisediminis TaxID=935616 RepID=A0ABV6NM20_9BACI|nr:hypothetical protein [Halalkalibacter alkalisediminis]